METQIRPDLSIAIGNTPMAKIYFTYKGQQRILYAKMESFNLTGSIKDRIAMHIIDESYRKGLLKPGDEIVEATSGNTGVSFAAVGAAYRHNITIYMPDWMSEERKQLIKSFGTNIRLVSKEEGGFLGSIEMTKTHKANNPNVFLPCQFDNDYNTETHYQTTGPEIKNQMSQLGIQPDAFVAGVGTGGTVMGTGNYLKEKYPAVKVHPLEPANSPTLSTGYKVGKHRIQGISDEFIPSIVKLDELDSIIEVDDGDSIIMAQLLARRLGIAVGISSGANFLGAIKAQEMLSPEANVVTIFSDSNKKYLSTDLAREESVKDDFLSTHVDLLGFELIACN
ncbi:MAG: cysteine synthase [Crocinitomicaceae bacterium]|nr:cysteine synthase [Crocinitomicaceae bacterium]|tara:strand:- start:10829 stop:11839 length:1011 start_codon:yes stop_codon:yes gene_type:complete